MPIYVDFSYDGGDESALFNKLIRYFRKPCPQTVRCAKKEMPDCVMYTFKNPHTRNTAVLRDERAFGRGVHLRVYDRLRHSAENLDDNHRKSVDDHFKDLDDDTLADLICVFLNKESEYARTPFTKIKATKNKIEDLAEDEVFVARIKGIGTMVVAGETQVSLQFEDWNGLFSVPAEEVFTKYKEPVGNFIVINRSKKFAIYTPREFERNFVIVETATQTSSPMELLPH